MGQDLKNRVLSFVKHRLLIPFIKRCRLADSKLFCNCFRQVLRAVPISAGTRVRLTRELIDGVLQPAPVSPAAEVACKIKPFPLVQLRGNLEKFARSIVLPMHKHPDVSVVIPVYNQIAYTLCCLRSIADNIPNTSFEIIIVDDCSTDQSERILPLVQGVRVIRNKQNLNFLKSVNFGCQHVNGKYIMLLNNDTQVQEGWLDSLRQVFTDAPGAGLVGSKVVYPSGHLQEAGARMKEDGSAVMIGLNDDPALPKYNYLREVDYCSGVSIMVPQSLFVELGGLDEYFAPCYYEDADLAYRIRQKGKKIFYQPQSVICHHLSVSTDNSDDLKMKSVNLNKEKFLQRWAEQIRQNKKIRLIAFYLPQFHTIPENDEWWGEGFTEWTNVRKAKPNFAGHVHPKVPGELGYYDLRDDQVRQRQIELAKSHGVDAFCYYYYWFKGKKLLETPLEMLLQNKELDFPFCICWANEDWTRTWDGESTSVLMEQEYSIPSYQSFIEDVFPLFTDERYLTIDGRPVLLVYRAERVEHCREALILWRQYCLQHGVNNPYLISVDSFGEAVREKHLELGFDAIVEFPPHAYSKFYKGDINIVNPDFAGNLFDYGLSAQSFMDRQTPGGKLFRCAMPRWDNTARRQENPDLFVESTPRLYAKWLGHNIEKTRDSFCGEEQLTFINAWNEWAEGNYLEPDEEYGLAYLQATEKVVFGSGEL